MKIIIANNKEYTVKDYNSDIEIYLDGERVAAIMCTGDEPVKLSGKVYRDGRNLSYAINKYNIKKLINRNQ